MEPESESDFSFGPYRLERRTRRLLRDGRPVPITTKAFDTLEVLVSRAGQTVSKEELLKEVWRGTFVQEETLTQNISTIRRALADTTDSPRYVLTVPREGYRFIAPVQIMAPPQPGVEAARHLDEPAAPPESGLQRRGAVRWIPYVAAIATGLSIATAGYLYWARLPFPSTATEVAIPITFEVHEPEKSRFSTSGGVLSMSPDGRHLAFLATDDDGRDSLWIRPLDSLESTRLPGTLDASQPFWSADSKSIAFFSGLSLRRIDVFGGPPRTVCSLPRPNAVAGSWSHDGLILFAILGAGIFEVEAAGGTATPVTVPGRGSCRDCLWPSFLLDGRRFLFTVNATDPDRGIYIGSLDGASPKRILDEVVSSATYLKTGYLLYVSSGALVARRFDPSREQLGADVVPVADRVWSNPGTRRAVFSASQTGLLAYREPQVSRLQWISRAGATISAGPTGVYHSFTVSSDGRVLASQLDPLRGTYDLWLHNSTWTAPTRLTLDPADDLRPLWSEDESATVFSREERAGWQLYEVKIDRPGVERPLLPQPLQNVAGGVSWNGDVLEYSTSWPSEPARLWTLRPGRPERPVLIHEAKSQEAEGKVSPDRQWLAYTMNVADSRVPNTALFVRPWSDAPGRSEIAEAGSVPRWRTDGRELFYITPGGRLMARHMDHGRPIGSPVHLYTTAALATSGLAGQAYDAAHDGQRFLIKVPARPPSIIVKNAMLPRLQQ